MSSQGNQGDVHLGEQDIQGVEVDVTGNKKWVMNYQKSDVDELYRDMYRASKAPASWEDVRRFVERHGESEWHITPGIAVAMKEDLDQVIAHHLPFTDNPDQWYQEMHQYRQQDMSEEPKIAKEMQGNS